jgi:hypothetical protein
MAEMLKKVSLAPTEIDFVLSCFNQAAGGSQRVWQSIYGQELETLRVPVEAFRSAKSEGRSHVGLSEGHWRRVIAAVNAAIYTLGPLELETVTAFGLAEAADTNLRICADVWGAYGKASWVLPTV